LIYGRAALLGLSGGERSCIQTYAKCPKNDVSYYICIFLYIRVIKFPLMAKNYFMISKLVFKVQNAFNIFLLNKIGFSFNFHSI